MRTVKSIFPLILETSHLNLILRKFIFINISKEAITEANLIESLDAEIKTYLERLTGVDLSETTDENKKTMFDLISNLLLLSNLDYNDDFNIRMRGLEKWLRVIDPFIINDPSSLYYNVHIKFGDLTSPRFILKKLNNGNSNPQELLKEYLCNYLVGYLSPLTPNFHNTMGLITCHTTKDSIPIENSQKMCSCVGIKYCVDKNYILSFPITGESINKKYDTKDYNLYLNDILKQLFYSLKIAEDKLGFYIDLNLDNILITEYIETKEFNYIIDGTTKKVISKIKITIINYNNSNITKNDFLKTKNPKMIDYYVGMGYNNAKGPINYKSFFNLLKRKISAKGFVIPPILTKLENLTNIDDIIRILESLSGGTLPIQVTSITDILQTSLDSFRLQDIKDYEKADEGVKIDGYNSALLYGPTPNFNYTMLLKEHEFYNEVGDINGLSSFGTICKGFDKDLNIVMKKTFGGNPGYSKYFRDENGDPVYFNNVKPSELLHPTVNGERISYTFSFVKDKFTGNINVRYGRIINLTEIGAKHTIISYGDPLIVSGEMAIKKNDETFIYYINTNSSKMNYSNSNIQKYNRPINDEIYERFYMIIVISLSFYLFKAIDSEIDLRYAPNLKRTLTERGSQGDDLVDYYDNKICPSDEFINAYNTFGRTHKIKNACIGFQKEDKTIENITTISDKRYKCEWDEEENIDSDYYNKYLKYKTKYLNLKKIYK